MSRAAPQRFLRFTDGAIVVAKAIVNKGERVGRTEVARICRLPDFQGSCRLVLVAGDAIVVLIRDEEALALADMALDVVGKAREFLAAAPLADAPVDGRQGRVSRRELGIVLDRL